MRTSPPPSGEAKAREAASTRSKKPGQSQRRRVPIAVRQALFLLPVVLLPMLGLAHYRQRASEERRLAIVTETHQLARAGERIGAVRDGLFERLRADAEQRTKATVNSQLDIAFASLLDTLQGANALLSEELVQGLRDRNHQPTSDELNAILHKMGGWMSSSVVQDLRLVLEDGTFLAHSREVLDEQGNPFLKYERMRAGDQRKAPWHLGMKAATALDSDTWVGWTEYQPLLGSSWPDQSRALAVVSQVLPTTPTERRVFVAAYLAPTFFTSATKTLARLGMEGAWSSVEDPTPIYHTPGLADFDREQGNQQQLTMRSGHSLLHIGRLAARMPPERIRENLSELDGSITLLEEELQTISGSMRDRSEELQREDHRVARWQLASILIAICAIVAGSIGLGRALRRITKAAAALSEGRSPQLAALIQRRDEVGELAERFAMTGQALEARRREVQAHAEELEERVTERTVELAEARDAAEAATQAKADFLAAMSHELRSPLQGVLALTDLMEHERSGAQLTRFLADQRACGEDMLQIVNDLMDFSKIEAGGLTLEARPFALNELFEGSFLSVARRATQAGLCFETAIDEGLPEHLVGDSFRLRQVIVNFCSNALKFTREGGIRVSLELETRRASRTLIRIAVKDSGIGIPPGRQAAIFEAFGQADTSTSRQYGGTGLGLTICQRIAEAMGGWVGVDSEVGRGSTFFITVELPVATPSPGAGVAGAHPQNPGFASSEPLDGTARRRILVTDDNALNRRIAVLALERAGYLAEQAEDGRQAFERHRQAPFDLILMDVHMPVLDGLAATRALRAEEDSESGTRTPIIGLTGEAGEEGRRLCEDAGMDARLTKPFRAEELIACVQEELSGSSKAPAS